MIAWQPVAIAALVILGGAAGGIGALCLLSAGMSDNAAEAAKVSRDGWVLGALGLLLVSAAFVVRTL